MKVKEFFQTSQECYSYYRDLLGVDKYTRILNFVKGAENLMITILSSTLDIDMKHSLIEDLIEMTHYRVNEIENEDDDYDENCGCGCGCGCEDESFDVFDEDDEDDEKCHCEVCQSFERNPAYESCCEEVEDEPYSDDDDLDLEDDFDNFDNFDDFDDNDDDTLNDILNDLFDALKVWLAYKRKQHNITKPWGDLRFFVLGRGELLIEGRNREVEREVEREVVNWGGFKVEFVYVGLGCRFREKIFIFQKALPPPP